MPVHFSCTFCYQKSLSQRIDQVSYTIQLHIHQGCLTDRRLYAASTHNFSKAVTDTVLTVHPAAFPSRRVLQWLPSASLIKHAFEAVCINEFQGLEFDADDSGKGMRTGGEAGVRDVIIAIVLCIISYYDL